MLNEDFDYNKMDNINNIIFKRNLDVDDRLYYYTCFYKINRGKLTLFQNTINELFDDIKNGSYEYEEWEVLLPNLLYGDFEIVEELGVTQKIAVWKDESKI